MTIDSNITNNPPVSLNISSGPTSRKTNSVKGLVSSVENSQNERKTEADNSPARIKPALLSARETIRGLRELRGKKERGKLSLCDTVNTIHKQPAVQQLLKVLPSKQEQLEAMRLLVQLPWKEQELMMSLPSAATQPMRLLILLLLQKPPEKRLKELQLILTYSPCCIRKLVIQAPISPVRHPSTVSVVKSPQ